eukprot:5008961-Alexandrium_andersonii.AAC.1
MARARRSHLETRTQYLPVRKHMNGYSVASDCDDRTSTTASLCAEPERELRPMGRTSIQQIGWVESG